MSQSTAQTVQLTSSSQFSPALALDPLSKMTAVQISLATPPSSATGLTVNAYIQMTNDTVTFGSAVAQGFPQPAPVWSQVGSSVYQIITSSLSAGTINSSQNTGYNTFDNAAMFVILQNIGGLRLASSAVGAIIGSAVITLKALQSPTA